MRTLHGGCALAAGLAISDLNLAQMWGRYLDLGGTHTQKELRVYLSGDTEWSTGEHDAAAHALNEYLTDQGLDHPVAYADEI